MVMLAAALLTRREYALCEYATIGVYVLGAKLVAIAVGE
jgi:hypothetical protein